MGLLKEEALRLLREHWSNPTTLAEELFAILMSDEPTTLNGPLTINNPSNGPAIVVNQTGGSPWNMVVQRPADGNITFGDLPSLPGTQPGSPPTVPAPPPGLTIPALPPVPGSPAQPPYPSLPALPDPTAPGMTVVGVGGNDLNPVQGPGLAPTSSPAPAGGGGGAAQGVFIGKVTGFGREGFFDVDLYTAGLGSSDAQIRTVNAKVPQLATNAQVPPDTWAIVIQVGNEFYFQPPVWL